jgi:flagellar assembly protein FliH
MPIIRRDNVRNGDPVPIRILALLPDGEEQERIEEAEIASAPPDGTDPADYEAYLEGWAARLQRQQAEIEARRENALEETRHAAETILADAAREADEFRASALTAAERDGQAIREEARVDGEAIRARAETEGFKAGMHQAEEDSAGLFRELRESVDAVVDEAHYQRVNLIRNAEDQVVALALEAARRMAADTLRDEDAYVKLVRAALARMLDKDWVRIRVNAADLERVRGMEMRFREAIAGLDHVEIVDDPRVDHGLLAETRHGTVDASVCGQMREVVAAIERALLAEPEGGGGTE